MYRYMPPKSSIWGHSLKRMSPAVERGLFRRFLKAAVSEHRQAGGSLTILVDPTQEVKARFQRLLDLEITNSFCHLSPQQAELCLDEFLGDPALTSAEVSSVLILQAFEISKWLIVKEEVPTESKIHMFYGLTPCISTFLYFETTEHFEHIQQVLKEIGLCKLNPKHLKPVRRTGS